MTYAIATVKTPAASVTRAASCLALAEPPAIRRKVSQHVGGKNALILDEVPEDKDRDDHGDRYDAGHQGPLPPDIGAGAKQERIDEAKDGAERKQPVRRLPWAPNVGVIDFGESNRRSD